MQENRSGYNDLEELRAHERLRQERETFDQCKKHQSEWFKLRLWISYLSAIVLATILIAGLIILFNHKKYPDVLVRSAIGCVFAGLSGAAATVWKFVLKTGTVSKPEPITKISK